MARDIHDGEALEKMLTDSGVSVGRFATLMQVGRNTPRRWFDTVNHPDSLLLRAAKELKMPAEDYFARFKKEDLSQSSPTNAARDESVQYGTTVQLQDPAIQKCIEERDKWRQLAYDNLEKYNALLVEHNQLLRLARLGNANPNAILSH